MLEAARFAQHFTTEQLVVLLEAMEREIPLSARHWLTITRAAGRPADAKSASRAAEQEAVAALIAQRLLVVPDGSEPARLAADVATRLSLVERAKSAFLWVCGTPLGVAPAFELFTDGASATVAAVTALGTVEIAGGAPPDEVFNHAAATTLDRFDTMIGSVTAPRIRSMAELRALRTSAPMIAHVTTMNSADKKREVAFFQTAPGVFVQPSNLPDGADVVTLKRDEMLALLAQQFAAKQAG